MKAASLILGSLLLSIIGLRVVATLPSKQGFFKMLLGSMAILVPFIVAALVWLNGAELVIKSFLSSLANG